MTTTYSPAEFMAGAAARQHNGNTEWAQRYAHELRQVIRRHAEQAPRSQQVHLGPSELGTPCDRQVAGKMARLPRTNHVADPWPAIVGTAVHSWLAEAFSAENDRLGRIRWVPEQRVAPDPRHTGTADLYDATERAVVDHKVLGKSSMDKLRRAEPPRHYVVQLLLYGRGYRNLGLPVDRVVLVAYPRSESSLDSMFVWERPCTPADDALLAEVFADTERRRQWAAKLITGQASLHDVPAHPDDNCLFCPFYRPESVRTGGFGCPGPSQM